MTSDEEPFDQIRQILVATDFSENAAAALDWAVQLAVPIGAKLALLHVVEPPAAWASPAPIESEVQAGLLALEQIVKRSGLSVESLCHPGQPWQSITSVAEERQADLIVLGTRGRSACARMLLGSTADRVIRLAKCPVLTVHAGDTRHGPVRTILVGTDFSEEAALATSWAARVLEGAPGAGRLLLVHACHTPAACDVGFGATGTAAVAARELEEQIEQSRRQLDAVACELRKSDLTVDTFVDVGYPPTVIESIAEKERADLIALGTRGRSGLSHLLLGSVAEHAVRHAGCPVLTVHRPGRTEPMHLSATSTAEPA